MPDIAGVLQSNFFQLIVLIMVIFYFNYHLDRKVDTLTKHLKNENKVLSQKISALTQLLSSYLRHH